MYVFCIWHIVWKIIILQIAHHFININVLSRDIQISKSLPQFLTSTHLYHIIWSVFSLLFKWIRCNKSSMIPYHYRSYFVTVEYIRFLYQSTNSLKSTSTLQNQEKMQFHRICHCTSTSVIKWNIRRQHVCFKSLSKNNSHISYTWQFFTVKSKIFMWASFSVC